MDTDIWMDMAVILLNWLMIKEISIISNFTSNQTKEFEICWKRKRLKLLVVNPDYATRDLFYSIAKGEFPSWSVYIQLMKPVDALT